MTALRTIHLAGRYYRAYPPDAPLGYTEDALELQLDETVFLLADVYVIKKQLYSGFFETHLDSLLRSLNARNLVTVGFDSRICLGTTVVDAMYRNYRVIALRDSTATTEY